MRELRQREGPLARPRSPAGGHPCSEQGRHCPASRWPPLSASAVRETASPSPAQSDLGVQRRPGPEAPRLARPPRPPGAAALGRAGGGTSGGGASWLPSPRPAWPRHRPAESALAERWHRAELGARSSEARTGAAGPTVWAGDVAAASPARKFPRSWLRPSTGPRAAP